MKRIFPNLNLSLWDCGIILLCSLPVFYLLGTPSIYIWDEAVYANASLDMARGASWWVPVHGEYNTKPPLVLWLQALSLLIVPLPEWAVRLPSALAATGILILLHTGLKRWGFDFWSRLWVMVCFVGHEGFIRHHISRTGDLDAVMAFFVVAYVMVVLDAVQQKRWTSRHLFFFFVAVVLAFYAKSIGGWLMLGPLALVWLLSPLRAVFLTPRFWLGVIITLLVCLLYYFVREMIQPGFLDLVWHSEYLRMFKNVMPWHEHGPSFYFNNFFLLKIFTPWVYFLVAASLYGLFLLKDKIKRNHLLQWMILGFGYMIVITIPAVKLEWYDAPAYPFFALILGGVAGHWSQHLPGKWKYLIFIPVAFILWRKLNYIRKDIHPRHPFEYEGSILRQTEVSTATKVFMKVETSEHQLQLDFYRKIIQTEYHIPVPVMDTIAAIETGDHIIVSQQDQLNQIADIFSIDTIKIWPGLGFEILISGRKH